MKATPPAGLITPQAAHYCRKAKYPDYSSTFKMGSEHLQIKKLLRPN